MRKIQNIAFLLLATLFASCINDNIEPTFCRDGELTLNFTTRSLDTRVQGDNDDINPVESIVHDLQYFLYTKGSEETAAPLAAGVITGITDNEIVDGDGPTGEEDPGDRFSKTVSIDATALQQLCPNEADECEIYVIANLLENGGSDLTTDLANATRAKLKATKLTSDFANPTTLKSFVMDSKGTDVVSRGTDSNINTLTSGTIYLTRAAAKVVIEVNVQNAIDVSGNTWEPITQVTDPAARTMYLSFYNGVTTGVIDDGTDEAGSNAVPTIDDAAAYYKVENVQMQSGRYGADGSSGSTSAVTRADESTSWISMVNFYSYANSWTSGDEDHEPYFELSIPWRKKAEGQDDSANWVTYKYTVPIAMNNNRFDRNKLYLIRLNVGALGDLSTLESYEYSYVVLNWDEVSVDATLTRPKYFVVDEEYVEVYNQDSYTVDFSASDIVSAEILSIIKPDYSERDSIEDNYIYGSETSTSGAATVYGSSLKADRKGNKGNENSFSVTVDNDTEDVDGDGKSLTLTHTLDNDMTSGGFDYVPYTVTVRATMTITDSAGNTSTMVKDITFKQYPAMYVYADVNVSFVEHGDEEANNDPENTFINGLNRSEKPASGVTNTPSQCGDVWGLTGESDNTNPNQYVLTVSSFTSNQPYVIADPRSHTSDVTGLQIGTIANSYAVDYNFNKEANKRQLTNYYRTIEDYEQGKSDSTDPYSFVTGWHIAPKYRIASSYSVVSDGCSSLEAARRRCATYQENGYPAGRWRLPTYAEIQLITVLSRRNIIPTLFTQGYWYWCAQGSVQGQSDGSVKLQATGAQSVRCVYDEWYWGKGRLSLDTTVEPNYTQFVWGDMKIW